MILKYLYYAGPLTYTDALTDVTTLIGILSDKEQCAWRGEHEENAFYPSWHMNMSHPGILKWIDQCVQKDECMAGKWHYLSLIVNIVVTKFYRATSRDFYLLLSFS